MKLIVGLGNPGIDYEKTRHNVGFMVIDKLSEKLECPLKEKKFNGIFYKDKDVILAKPLTYMNNSGEFVKAIVEYYDVLIDDIIVVYDDMDTELGKVTIRQSGSSGGHNGIKSIIQHLNTQDIKRLKIGIGRNENAINFVLGKFSFADSKIIEKVVDAAADALIQFIGNDIRYVMNNYSGKIYGK
ncbi:aminoacyl-tRNA hydrolase [Mycoplasmopsis arginini]|uniref:Peptidyl-tRNA hydrolase n=1 Tax=Mycoplasmopsis arginini TaxID=2094 RepID=A0ABZ2AM15_MYCAR|nr:aminoacyl-tRNA hydrolase [Mycoplasmopsis arginini]WVN21942.1 aminoacyl-tRNA hydrolase [Mycoplasmopsis arginini]VEU81954.1 peptidyl-tRNA hydrolase [Mycoplasmopsis arginini]